MKAKINSIIGVIVIYSLFAFAIWDLNPNNWAIEARAFCAFLMAIPLVMLIPYFITKNLNEKN